jgi:hypothetical protein
MSTFEYLYRDAGNYKIFGEISLVGEFTQADIAKLKAVLLIAYILTPKLSVFHRCFQF